MALTYSSGSGELSTCKVCLLGEGCVGKTSIVVQYIDGKFPNTHQATLQAAYFDKTVNLDGRRLKLAIWDTAGQERFHALGPIYYRDSRAAILVYDITDPDSFNRVKKWVRELRQILGSNVLLVIVGNKMDLESDRKVDLSEAENYAESVGASHFQTSAKLNRGIHDLFLHISKKLLSQMEVENVRSSGVCPGPVSSSGVTIVDDTHASGASSHSRRCCG